MSRLQCDVLIVGGGLVGSALANTLAQLPLRTVLVEARDPALLEQPSFDARATALANGSMRVLDTLGLWAAIAPQTEPIRRIHVSERGSFGVARIDAVEEGVDALGYTVENRELGRALWDALGGADAFECIAPATLERFDAGADSVNATLATGDGTVEVSARLLVAADGARSRVRESLGIEAYEDVYPHHAVVFNCATEKALDGEAFERFMRPGPVAVLPLTGARASVVWNLPPDRAAALVDAGEDEAAALLQEAFGYRAGAIRRVGRRAAYPLSRIRSASTIADRVVLTGNAAMSVHPVAGQGFNLALRDVVTLAEVIATTLARDGDAADIGAPATLRAYRDWRAADQRAVAAFTHGLIRLFGLDVPAAGIVRGLGLAVFDLLPGARSLLARHTMGRAGRLPRLVRGLDLFH